MTLVFLKPRMHDLLLAVTDKLEMTEIIKHGDCSPAENFDAFFRIGLVAIGEIANCSLRAVSEAQRNNYVVARVLPRVSQTAGLYFNRQSSSKKAKEINKMTPFAENAPTTDVRIVDPMIWGKVTDVHTIMQR